MPDFAVATTFFGKDKVSEVLPELMEEDYNHIIDLHKNIRSKQVISNLKKSSSTFNKINIAKWLIVNFKKDRLPDVHIVDRYFETVQNLGVKNDNKGLDYFIPGKNEVDLKDLPQQFHEASAQFRCHGKPHKEQLQQ